MSLRHARLERRLFAKNWKTAVCRQGPVVGEWPPGHQHQRHAPENRLRNIETDCLDRLQLAPLNREGLNSTHFHGTHVPVEAVHSIRSGHSPDAWIKYNEGLAGAPLAAQQPMAAGRDQMLDQPALQRPRILIAMRKQCRELRIILLRRLILQLPHPPAQDHSPAPASPVAAA